MQQLALQDVFAKIGMVGRLGGAATARAFGMIYPGRKKERGKKKRDTQIIIGDTPTLVGRKKTQATQAQIYLIRSGFGLQNVITEKSSEAGMAKDG